MLITTTETIPGRKITKVLGLVKGSTVRAQAIGKDILAFAKNLVGGEIKECTKLLAETREQSLDRMIEEAKEKGANAIVGVNFSTSDIEAGAAEILVYGTAVIIR